MLIILRKEKLDRLIKLLFDRPPQAGNLSEPMKDFLTLAGLVGLLLIILGVGHWYVHKDPPSLASIMAEKHREEAELKQKSDEILYAHIKKLTPQSWEETDWEEVEAAAKQVLEMNEEYYGKNHPKILPYLIGFAGYKSSPDELAEGKELMERAEQIIKRKRLESTEIHAVYYEKLAQINGFLETDIPTYEKAYEIRVKLYGAKGSKAQSTSQTIAIFREMNESMKEFDAMIESLENEP
jgi:hypothetical protein